MEQVKNPLLGKKAHDPITNYSGTVTSITEYLTGSNRCCLESLDGEGKIITECFDVERIVID